VGAGQPGVRKCSRYGYRGILRVLTQAQYSASIGQVL
jgi:hypothetical protein